MWADSASGPTFGGANLFQPRSTKAQVLYKLGRTAEADAIMKEAMPIANIDEMHAYGKALIQQKKLKDALDIFKLNYQRHPDQFTTVVGLMRGYSANGDYKNALKYAKQGLTLAPNAAYKVFMEGAIKKLEDGKDMN